MAQELAGMSAIILAGGKGTRMKSRLPKVLHPVVGEPMINHPLRAVAQAGIAPAATVVVVGYAAEQVRKQVSARGPYLFAEQPEQLGTGHAVMMAQPVLEDLEKSLPARLQHVMVLYGDNALLRPQTLSRLIERHLETAPLVTMATSVVADPTGYGRIIRDPATGRFQAIVEQPDLAPEQHAITEFNPGVYIFRRDWLQSALKHLKISSKGEYYLTDLAGLAVEEQPGSVETVPVDYEEVLGINDRVQLAEVSKVLRDRILRELMLSGVTIIDPASTYISASSQVGPDTIIEPNTYLRGDCRVGSDCVLGPNSILTDVQLGNGVRVLSSVIEKSLLEDEVQIGPFSRIRPGCHLEKGVHMGNFAEVNRSRVGAGTKQSHFSYIGDATIGPDVNVGAGTITANYDGVNKHKTRIGARVFLGCDTILRAPVALGEEARTGAGSVITRDVAPGATVVGMPARLIKRKRPLNDAQDTDNGTSSS